MSAPTPTLQATGLGYRPALDGIRAAAILAVLIFHTNIAHTSGGFLGVNVFFVLSGFLITSLLLEEDERTDRISLRKFYARRALRLLPALVVVVLVTWISAVTWLPDADRTANLRGGLAALFYASSPLAAGGVQLGVLGIAWSLAIEEHFYFLWPPLLWLIRKVRFWPIVASLGLVAMIISVHRAMLLNGGASFERLFFGDDTRADDIIIGCATAFLVRKFVPATDHGRRWLRAAACASAAGLAVFVVAGPDLMGLDDFFSFLLGGGMAIIALLSALVIYQSVAAPGGPLTATLASKPMVWVGRRSYGLYLWHLLVYNAVPQSVSFNLATPLRLALTFAIAALSYRFVEEPFLRRKRRFQARRPDAHE